MVIQKTGIRKSAVKKRLLNSMGMSIPKRWGSIIAFRYTKNTTQLIAAAKISKIKYLATCQGLFILPSQVKFSVKRTERLQLNEFQSQILRQKYIYSHFIRQKTAQSFY
jgi:hypothetical protein